ncbi:MAG: Peptidyl-tRNA hydrolase [Parcubacteria group bacterium GW2011_GWC1_38_6]|nr:MAG: Peptidyl-tRNA hydrolase [Parcubacteria group bacterium GW2011_GWC1_38_6]
MIVIVGLGNLGKKFERTRHNFGFLIVDELQKNYSFQDWQKNKTNICFYSWGTISDKKVELVKPLTFMNDSGRAIAYVIKKHRLNTNNGLYVIHDDIDLALGKFKISAGRGAAGHKGVESIIKTLKNNEFLRFRVGIQPLSGKPRNAENFVIKQFSKKEQLVIGQVIEKTIQAVLFTIAYGPEAAMNKFN